MMVGSEGSVKATAEEGGVDAGVWGATKACRGCCETDCDDDGKVKRGMDCLVVQDKYYKKQQQVGTHKR